MRLVVAVLAIATVVHLMRYESWPLAGPPKQIAWCDMGWERSDGSSPWTGERLYPVARRPPLIGTQLYSPYAPDQRRRLNAAKGGACGAVLYARDGARRVVAYEMAPDVPH